MAANNKDWINKPMRIAAKQSRLSHEKIEDNFNRFPKAFHCNVEQMNHIFKGTDPLAPDAYSGEFIEEMHSEMLDKYVENAHKNGVKIICYFLLHQIFEKDKNNHPDWIQVDKNRNPVIIYGCDYAGCPCSAWGSEYTLKRISQLCTHNIDGIFLDGPVFYPNCCYCDSCKEKFRQKYGKELVDATYDEYMEFRLYELTQFVANIRNEVNKVNPNIVLYLNNSALCSDFLGSNTRRLSPYVDIIGAEGGFFQAINSDSLYTCSAYAKDIEDKAEGKPIVIFTKAERAPSPFTPHTPAETKRVLAQTVANGANIWYGIHGPIETVDTETGLAVKEFFGFLEKNEQAYTGTRNIADAAVVCSLPTANYYASSILSGDFAGKGSKVDSKTRADHRNEYMGFVELMAHNHILFDSLDEVSLETKINNYSLVVLPCCAAMSESNKTALKKYVKNGGTVIASFDTAIMDETGTVTDYSFMEELFGIKYQEVICHDEHFDYLELTDNAFNGILPTVITGDKTIKLETTTATVQARFYELLSGRYKELKGLSTPAVTTNNFGKGKAVFIAENIGSQYGEFKTGQVSKMFSCLADEALERIIKTNAPACVEVTLRENNNAYILHIINNSTDCGRPIETTLPIYDLNFEICVNSVTSVKALKDEQIEFAVTQNGIKLHLNKLNDYTVIMLNK